MLQIAYLYSILWILIQTFGFPVKPTLYSQNQMTEPLPYREQLKLIRQGLMEKTTGAKPKKSIPKVSKKREEKIKAEREERNGEDSFLVKWFKARMKVMGTTCNECGCQIEHRVYKYAILSICHILAKRDTVCPSVKYHPLNFIILCPYHHDQLDKSNWEEIEKWGCFPIIRDRLIMVYPDLAEDERRHFPESVLNYMTKNQPF